MDTNNNPITWDERDYKIKTALFEYLDWLDGRKDYAPRGEYSIRDMIAWLEKQQGGKDKFTQQHSLKEDSNVNDETNAPTEYGKYVDECLNEASKHFFSEGEDKYSVADLFYAGVRCGQSWLEKQGEQKSYGQRQECIDCQFNYAGECKGSCILKNTEQKPDEWSEEDEKNWRRAIRATQVVYPVAADWLKSLKDRVQPRPKQEWSEEDETGWTNTMIMIKECASNHYTKDSIKLVTTWLKSLKQRIGG